jgi:hypothetical protein
MTYREKVLSVIHLASNPKLLGGMPGCPGHYEITSDGPACGGQGCIGAGAFNCEKCWNTEMPESKIPGVHTEQKKTETPMGLIVKALESNDKSVHILVQPDGTISVNIIPFVEEKEEAEVEDEPAEIEGWYEIEYGIDKRGMRVITKNEPPEYVVVNVYCPEKDRVFAAFWSRFRHAWTVAGWSMFTDEPAKAELKTPVTHWMPVPKAPKEGE